MIELRGYQHALYDLIVKAWLTVLRVLAVCPTGGGKTILFAKLIRDHVGGCAAVVHRKEIVSQISMALATLGVKHRIVAPQPVVRRIRRRHLKRFGRSFIDDRSSCGVCSVQTLTSRGALNNKDLQKWVKQVTFAVFDEGHHYVRKGKWATAVEGFGEIKMLFVTATPERADGLGLGTCFDGFADVMVEGPTTKWLIDEGYLSPYKWFAAQSDIDVEDIPITASGEFNANVFRQRVKESNLVGDVVQQYCDFAHGMRVIVFCSDVATGEEETEKFSGAGFDFAFLDGTTDDGVREDTVLGFENGRYHGLVNVDLFDEGFDVPAVDAAILSRRTASLAKFLQMVGRALRPVYAEGYDLTTTEGRRAAIANGPKPYAAIIDPVGNWEIHGLPDWPRGWTLARKEKGTSNRDPDLKPLRSCDGCSQLYEAFMSVCPYCGTRYEPLSTGSIRHVDGVLQELDVDVMAALFEKHRLANMHPSDYEATLMGDTRMHPMGRAQLVKSHNAALYRRNTLKGLIGYWVGTQQQLYDRPINEIHHRFYHRFGVDIMTAETLNASDTDALIEKIKDRFTHDFQ